MSILAAHDAACLALARDDSSTGVAFDTLTDAIHHCYRLKHRMWDIMLTSGHYELDNSDVDRASAIPNLQIFGSHAGRSTSTVHLSRVTNTTGTRSMMRRASKLRAFTVIWSLSPY